MRGMAAEFLLGVVWKRLVGVYLVLMYVQSVLAPKGPSVEGGTRSRSRCSRVHDKLRILCKADWRYRKRQWEGTSRSYTYPYPYPMRL